MLKPFWMLEGEIREIKRIDLKDKIELWYEDEKGSRAIIIEQRRQK